MKSITAVGEANHKLAQFKEALKNSEIKSKENIKWVLDKLDIVSSKVLATKYLELHHPDWIGNTALHFAAMYLNTHAFDILLDRGANFTLQNNGNLTALHLVIEIKAPSITKASTLDDTLVDFILSAHIKYQNFENPLNNNGLSHFHIACAADNIKAANGFLQNGVTAHQTVKEDCSLFPGFTPLHFAARYSAFVVAKLLLSYKASLNIKDSKLMTPLQLALEQKIQISSTVGVDKLLKDRNDSMLKLFLQKESNDDMMIVDNWGLSHFHIASTLDDSKIAENYLKRVVNINHTVNMNSPLWAGYTALHFAALCNIETVKLIMKKGGDINVKDAKGITSFSMCVEKYNVEDICEILYLHPIWKNIMLSDGRTKLSDLILAMKSLDDFTIFYTKNVSGVRIHSDSPLWPGCTPMHLAVIFAKNTEHNENQQILKKLLEQNTSMINSQDVHGRTPLHLAFYFNKSSVLDVFLCFLDSHPTWVDCIDENGLSYMHIASSQDNIKLLKRMLSIGSNINAVYKGKTLELPVICSGSTALHLAINNTSTTAIEILVKKSASVCVKDEDGMTPIHRLFYNYDTMSAKLLFSSSNLKDSVVSDTGLSHLHVACRYWKAECIESLLNNGANINGIITYQLSPNTDPSELSFYLEKYVGCSPFHVAFRSYCTRVMQLLLQLGADIFVQNAKGKALLYSLLEVDTNYPPAILEFLKKSDKLQARLRAETGIPVLHIACLVNNKKSIEKLLSEGADVNEQISSDSPIFQGYTPLHILMFVFNCFEVEKTVKLFLNKGADVTLVNALSDTPIHMVYKMFNEHAEMAFSHINMMLEAQSDFNLNPTNISGISHFHIACRVFNTNIIQEFLDNAEIDINQPIDCFHDYLPGYTALHLATMGLIELDSDSNQLETIDFLLRHGANVQVEDVYGDTALFNCFRTESSPSSIDLFERIARAGADVNARSLTGNTPISDFLDSDEVTANSLKTLLRLGCRLNEFNIFTNHGYIAKIFRQLNLEELSRLFSALIANFAQEISVDNNGRTVIHNIVSNDQFEHSENKCITYIEKLSKVVCDIDDQDKLGRTALHSAAKFYNTTGISELLMAGADINIRDNNGKTAMLFEVDRCTRCDTYEKSNDPDEDKCSYSETLEILAVHVKKLQLCGLNVSEQNADFACEAFGKLKNSSKLIDGFLKELEIIKDTYIESLPLTLYEFLSETGVIASYPRMSLIKRNIINKFFSVKNAPDIRKRLPESAGILQLQYRKARVRPELLELAKTTMTVFIGYVLPEICSEFIFALLSNAELKNFITANK